MEDKLTRDQLDVCLFLLNETLDILEDKSAEVAIIESHILSALDRLLDLKDDKVKDHLENCYNLWGVDKN